MEYLLITLIMFLGAFLQGITGFGSGLIAVPLLAIFLPLTLITPLLSVINLVLALYLSWMLRHAIQLRQWLPLLFTGVLGTLVGNFLLVWLNVDLLQLIMALLVITVGLIFWFGLQLKSTGTPWQQGFTGTIAGFCNGALTLSGPPVVLFLTSYGLARVSFRATLAVFFFTIAVTNVLSFSLQGSYELAHIPMLLAMAAGALIGGWIGHRISDYLSEQLFRKVSLLLVIAAGIIACWSALQKIF